MSQTEIKQYNVEMLQEVYELSLPKAIEVLDRFGGDSASIEKMMKRCPRRGPKNRRWTRNRGRSITAHLCIWFFWSDLKTLVASTSPVENLWGSAVHASLEHRNQ